VDEDGAPALGNRAEAAEKAGGSRNPIACSLSYRRCARLSLLRWRHSQRRFGLRMRRRAQQAQWPALSRDGAPWQPHASSNSKPQPKGTSLHALGWCGAGRGLLSQPHERSPTPHLAALMMHRACSYG